MSILDDVAAHLTELQLAFRLEGERLRTGFSARNTSYEVILLGRPPLLTAVAPEIALVPESRLEEVIRMANRLNADCVRWGGFWVDTSRRRLGFELAMPALDTISRDMVLCVLAGLDAVDRFYPAFGKVMWANMSADEAFASFASGDAPAGQVEASDHDLDEAI
jgi:hypothetical protein